MDIPIKTYVQFLAQTSRAEQTFNLIISLDSSRFQHQKSFTSSGPGTAFYPGV